jgi:hypothetical protein
MTAQTVTPITEVTPAAVAATPLQEFSGLAPAALKEMLALYVSTGGGDGLAPHVLDKARDSKSALHRYFEWDDSVAAEAHRLTQAETLVRKVHVTLIPTGATDPVRVRAFVATRDLHDAATAEGDTDVANASAGSYKMVGDLTGSSAYEAAVLNQIKGDLRRLQHKYRAHQELFKTVVLGLANPE